MKQCAAIVLNGSDIIKVSNLKRKYNKIINNPNMKILEECSIEKLDEKYEYWNRTLNRNTEEKERELRNGRETEVKVALTTYLRTQISALKPQTSKLKSLTTKGMNSWI